MTEDKKVYTSFNELVTDIGDQTIATIRANTAFYTMCTVTGSHDAFRQRCSVLLNELSHGDLLKLLSDVDCGNWTMPEHAGTLARAVRFSIIDHIDAAYTSQRLDVCFEWASGKFLRTLERCAETAGDVVSVRKSRDVQSAGESVGRFLARVHYEGKFPEHDLAPFLESKSTMFRPAVNDQYLDQEALRRLGVERHHLFELMALLSNYVALHNVDRARFLKLADDELKAHAAARAVTAHA